MTGNIARFVFCQVVALSVLPWAISGCGTESLSVNPAPTDAGDTDAGQNVGVDSGTSSTVDAASEAAGSVEPGPVVREVFLRDPLGKLNPANMLHDGDFELSGLDSIQYPWLGMEQSYVRTGAICRSGLRCIQMPPRARVFGAFVWPDAPFVEISFYGKPESSLNCNGEAVGVLLMLDARGTEIRIESQTVEPVDGWCRYARTISVPQEPGYHYWALMIATRSSATGPMTFDDAAMIGRTQAAVFPRSMPVLPPREVNLVEAARIRAKELLPPNPPYRPKPVKNPTGRRH